MKILILSDSHGKREYIDLLFQNYTFDYLIFLGDGISDFGSYEYLSNVIIVSGNNDFFSQQPIDRIMEFAGKKIFMTHGHKYSVKLGLGAILSVGKQNNVDYILYGHTHNRLIEKIDNITIVNPGALCNGCGVLLEIDRGREKLTTINL